MTETRGDTSLPPTTSDLAKAAGVSLATVDRVLNKRPGVRSKTIERVQNAILKIGYVRDTAAANLARGRRYNLLFILPQGTDEFTNDLEAQIVEHAARNLPDRTSISHIRVPVRDPQAMARTISDLDVEDYDGVAIFGPETPSIRDAVDGLRDHRIPVVSLVSDLPSSARDHFVGIDNIAAGRTAGQLMGWFLKKADAKVLVLAGSMLARNHLERRLGFDRVFAEAFPNIEALPSIEGQDDPDRLEELLAVAFETTPNIAGIYSLGGGNAGVARFLNENDLAKKIVVVSHELTETSRKALLDGTFDATISQDTGHLVRSAIRVLRAKSDGSAIIPSQETIRIDIFLKENVPPVKEALDTEYDPSKMQV